MTPTVTPAAARPAARTMMLGALAGGVPVAVLVPLLTWAAVGAWGALSALVGSALSLVVFALGVVGIRGVLAGPTATTMAGAFGVFVLQMAALGAVIWALGQTTWLQIVPLVVAFVLVGLVFQAGLVIGYLRSRSPLDLPSGGGGV
ncbi:hypothetical protein [Serinicoccus sediminis]|uniref:hypothetical protein n=1 Tax=Serinicoccus sediminis TaxID=2306021 RepID=UPI001020B5E8|nr:hypothetical protein [Serinicoccus sediminis]